jgi:hypothetical protein
LKARPWASALADDRTYWSCFEGHFRTNERATAGTWKYLRFCQHYTGEGYKSEEQLQTESKILV